MLDEIELARIVTEIETHLWRKRNRPLKSTEKLLLEAVFTNSTYKEVGEAHGYTESFLQNVGSNLFSILSEASGTIINKRNGKQALTLLAKSGLGPTKSIEEAVVRVEIYLAGDRPKVISVSGSNYETFIKPATARYSHLFAQTVGRCLNNWISPKSLTKDFAENITTNLWQNMVSQSNQELSMDELNVISTLVTLYADPQSLDAQSGSVGWRLDVELYADFLKSLVFINHHGCLLTNFSLKQIGNGKICAVDSDRHHAHRWISLDVPIGQILPTIDDYLHK